MDCGLASPNRLGMDGFENKKRTYVKEKILSRPRGGRRGFCDSRLEINFRQWRDCESAMTPQWVAGVDGCRAWWVVAFVGPNDEDIRVSRNEAFHGYFRRARAARPCCRGHPDRAPGAHWTARTGPERAVRPLLGDRQSSVFAVPSRRAVYTRGTTAKPAFWPWKRPTRPKKCPSSSS